LEDNILGLTAVLVFGRNVATICESRNGNKKLLYSNKIWDLKCGKKHYTDMLQSFYS